MPSTALLRDWKKNHVYMIQYPRCRPLPNLSPWSLKLETWLRMAEIPFTNISNEFTKFSSKGQVPFIELNGRQIADSNIIIDTLKQEFGKADIEPSDPKEQAIARAFTALAEDHLTWALFSMGAKDSRTGGLTFALTDDGWGRYHGTGMKKKFNQFMLKKKMSKRLVIDRVNAQGMGRHTIDELVEMAKEALKSISVFLGDRPYFGGDRPTTLDATMFGHLAGLIFIPGEGFSTFINETCPNLLQFEQRVKEKYWPDWEETCSTMNMNAHHKKD